MKVLESIQLHLEARMNTHKNARLTGVSHDEPSLNITAAKNKVLNKSRILLFESDQVDTVKRNVAARTNTHALLIVLEEEEFQGPDFAAVKTMLKRPVIFDGRNFMSHPRSTNKGLNMSPSTGKFKRTLCAV